jgi:hypothetical protein
VQSDAEADVLPLDAGGPTGSPPGHLREEALAGPGSSSNSLCTIGLLHQSMEHMAFRLGQNRKICMKNCDETSVYAHYFASCIYCLFTSVFATQTECVSCNERLHGESAGSCRQHRRKRYRVDLVPHITHRTGPIWDLVRQND